jgi:hypothetical protein
MRFKARGLLLALVAVLAMSAVTAAAASATTPEFKPVPAKKKFTGASGALVWEWGEGSEKIACSKGSTTGEITSARNVGDVVMAFTGCKSSSATKSNCPINSKGAKAEEIVTAPLTGELGTLTVGSKVGLRIEGSPKKWFTAVENACTWEAAWTGSVAAEVGSIGVKQTTSKLVFSGSKGQQGITEIKLDSGVVEKPELVTFSAGVSTATTDTLTFEEPVEVT